MAAPNWDEAEDTLFEQSQEVIQEFGREHPDTELSLFAFTVDAEFGGVGLNFDTPVNSLKKAKAHQRYEVEYRNRLFASDRGWKNAQYYVARATRQIVDFNDHGPWQFEVVKFVPLKAWEQAWEEYCSIPSSDEDEEETSELEGRIIVALWRVVDRMVVARALDVLKRAAPFRIGYAFHDSKFVVLRILDWPEVNKD